MRCSQIVAEHDHFPRPARVRGLSRCLRSLRQAGLYSSPAGSQRAVMAHQCTCHQHTLFHKSFLERDTAQRWPLQQDIASNTLTTWRFPRGIHWASPNSQATSSESQSHLKGPPPPRRRSLVIVLDLGPQLLGDVVHQHGQQLLLQGLAAHDQRGQLHGIRPL